MVIENLFELDKTIFFFVNKTLANPFFDFILKASHQLPYIFWGLLIIFYLFRRRYQLALLMIIAIAINFLVVSVLKDLIGRERPYQVLDVRQLVGEEDNRSFPSNHVQLSVLLSTVVLFFDRRFGVVLFILSLVIAFGRIYLGVHYPSDVLGGAIIGFILAKLILIAKDKFINQERLKDKLMFWLKKLKKRDY